MLCFSTGKPKQVFRNYFWSKFFILFFLAIAVFSYIQKSPTLPDPDSWYHAKMALLVRDEGVIKDFRWLPFTTLGENYTDHHFLYHVLLIPFVSVLPPLVGLKFATILFAAAFVGCFYWFLSHFQVKYAWWYSLLLLFVNPFIFRINLAKAAALSLILLFLIIYAALERRYWLLGVLSFVYTWTYGGWALSLVAVGLYCLIVFTVSWITNWRQKNAEFSISVRVEYLKNLVENKYYQKFNLIIKKIERFGKNSGNSLVAALAVKNMWILLAASLGGIIFGMVSSFYWPENLMFLWQQLFKIGIINQQQTIGVGGEWHSYGLVRLLNESFLVVVLVIAGLVSFAANYKNNKEKEYLFLGLFMFFFLITLKSQRYVEYLIPFAVLFSAWAINNLLKQLEPLSKKWWLDSKVLFSRVMVGVLLVGIYILLTVPYLLAKDVQTVAGYYEGGSNYDHYEEEAVWMKDNIPAGEVVLHSDWDDFPFLFFHDSTHRYISGLDPTFMYEYNKNKYWFWVDLTLGKVTDNYLAKIKSNFGAKYVFIENDHEAMMQLFENSEVVKIFSGKEATIFEILE